MTIKKGDYLLIKIHGMEVPVTAAADGADGYVEIRLGKSGFSTIGACDVVRIVPRGEHLQTFLDPTKAQMPCETCGAVGVFQAPAVASLDGTESTVTFACKGHQWSRIVPAKFVD
jgi:hypothetical protein